MDPATIVGLIASVVQIVEFTTDVVRESHDLVRTGRKPTSLRIIEVVKCQQDACERLLVDIAREEAIETEKVAEDIAEERPSGGELEQSPSLLHLAKSCVEEASLLTKTLNSLAVKPRDNGTMPLGAALWSVGRARMKKKDIEDAQRKLQANISTLLLHTISRAQKKNTTTTNDLVQSVSSNQTIKIESAIAHLKTTSEAHATKQTNLLTELRDSIGGVQFSHIAGPVFSQVPMEIQSGPLDQLDYNRAAREAKACERILQSLDFSERTRRQMAIQDAHHDTFDWMFQPGSSPIQDWARSSRGVFWINGKAGSGKSTLMKHISGHSRTKALLQEWALRASGGSRPVVRKWSVQESVGSKRKSLLTESLLQDWASPGSKELDPATDTTITFSSMYAAQARLTIVEIYFWYLGADLQKSEDGLLKSMLYQILHDSRELLPIACPKRWASVRRAIEAADARELDLHLDAASVPWTCFELRAALDRVAECTSDRRFAFFIDGLDEYDADQSALVKLIQKLARNPNFKFCVSSRPWNVFVNAFTSQQDMFILEELTRSDIWKYVHSELAPNVPDKNDAELKLLCAEVVEKAQGVFLWVFLAVRSLREGLEEDDDIRILRRRLSELPADLEEYFDVILSRVHKVYRNHTATALYMSHRAVQLQHRDTAWSLTDGHHRSFLNFWLLKQGMENEDFALKQEIVHVDVPRCHEMVIQTSRFISACCKDLLCVPKPPPADYGDEQTYMTQYKVEFLHRTVFEYLNESRILGRLQSSAIPHVLGPRFDIMSALARLSFVPIHSAGCLRFLKETLQGFEESGPHDVVVYQHLDRIAAHYLEFCTCSGTCTDECKTSRLQYFPNAISHRMTFKDGAYPTKPSTTSLLQDLVSRRHLLFVTALLRINPLIAHHDDNGRRPLLCKALGYESMSSEPAEPLQHIDNACVHAYIDSLGGSRVFDPFMSELRDRLICDWYRGTGAGQVLDGPEIWSIARRFIRPRFENATRKLEKIEGKPSMIKVLYELVPASHRHELDDLLAGRRSDVEQSDIRHAEEATKDTEKDVIVVKEPRTLTVEETEAYFRRTGFRP